MRVYWERVKRATHPDFEMMLVVERNGKRCKTHIYWEIYIPPSAGEYRYMTASEIMCRRLDSMSLKRLPCKDPIDIHYRAIRDAIKRGLENTEPEYEIRNYLF